MIFISYSHGEQELVQVIASRLSEIYGKEKIFYDEWSIQRECCANRVNRIIF